MAGDLNNIEPCPCCGAFPIDWANNPFKEPGRHDADPIAFSNTHNWGFWDETWSHFYGNFISEETARIGLAQYAAKL